MKSKMMESTRRSSTERHALRPHLLVLLGLLLFLSTAALASGRGIVRLSSGMLELSIIPHEMAGANCSLQVCPSDTVTNFYFNDIIPNDDPCYLARLLNGSSAAGLVSVGDGEQTLELGMAAMMDIVLNSGIECTQALHDAFEDFSCVISDDFEISGKVYMRMVENLTPSELDDIGSLESCVCDEGASRFIVNMVVPSFCGSLCTNDVECVPGYTADEMDYILFRHQLRTLRQKVASQRCGMKAAAEALTRYARQPTSASFEEQLTAQAEYRNLCLPEALTNIPNDLTYITAEDLRR